MPKQKQKQKTGVNQPASISGALLESNPSAGTSDAVTLLTQDHRHVEQLFEGYRSGGSAQRKAELARRACRELIIHTQLEEEIFYPACRAQGVKHELLDEAQVEHDTAKVLIAELLDGSNDALRDAKFNVLAEYIKHHVGEEERAGEGIFAKAQQAGLDMRRLGQRLQARKAELTEALEAGSLSPPRPHSLRLDALRGSRFVADERDRERGRYEDNHRYSRSRDADIDIDRYSYRGAEGRGWYGEREGHSRAAERGWVGRASGRGDASRRDDENDRYARQRGGEDQDWYGDPQRRSHAAESGWGWEERGRGRGYSSHRDEDDEHRYEGRGGVESRGGGEGRGWYGDPQGHSRAAERGWEERGGQARRGGRGYSSHRDEEDEHRYEGRGSFAGRVGSEGPGWYGDHRRHADAARRGWRNR